MRVGVYVVAMPLTFYNMVALRQLMFVATMFPKQSKLFTSSYSLLAARNRDATDRLMLSRRSFVCGSGMASSTLFVPSKTGNAADVYNSSLKIITGPEPSRLPALVYSPEGKEGKTSSPKAVIICLHGAGKNDLDAWDLANIKGEHAGFLPSLIANGLAPTEVIDNFVVISPYSKGKASLYEESRRNVIDFIEWALREEGIGTDVPVFLFGFSDGATLAVELLTTGRFNGAVVAAYGFTGTLPKLAQERLKGIPMWVFHSADDVIFDVTCSDNLVRTLRKANQEDGRKTEILYSRFDSDQEGFTGRVRGHSTGITASKNAKVFEWLLSQ